MILCIGHSHLFAVQRAATLEGESIVAYNFWQIPGAVTQHGDDIRFLDDIEHQLRSHPGPIFSLIGGSAHNVLGMLVHPRRFDVVLPARPDLPLDALAECLPYGAVRGMVEAEVTPFLSYMRRLRALSAGTICQLEPPPPSAEVSAAARDLLWGLTPHFMKEVSPAAMRWKLWRMQADIVQQFCVDNGFDYLACPGAAVDDGGYLRAAFDHDGAHANDEYGRLVLEQMRRYA
jgi:hypothetical protein